MIESSRFSHASCAFVLLKSSLEGFNDLKDGVGEDVDESSADIGRRKKFEPQIRREKIIFFR